MTVMGTLIQKKGSVAGTNFCAAHLGSDHHARYFVFMTDKTGASSGAGEPVRADHPHAQIATKLRALYVSVQEEAIPDRFLDLLEQLDAVERRHVPDVAK